MVERVVGAAVAGGCVLFGGFLTLASIVALLGGKDDFYLYFLAILGAGLVLCGCAIAWNLARRRVLKRATESDESW